MDPTVLAANLRRVRVAKKLGQGEIAEAAGLSRVGYRNIETGEVTPRIDSLMKIAKVLGVGLEELLAPARTLSHVRFRAQKKMTARDDLLEVVARDLEHYNLLETLVGNRCEFAFSAVREEFRRNSAPITADFELAKRAAAKAREAAKLDHGGTSELVRDLCGLLEDRGVKVLTPRNVASEGFFGLSVDEADGGPAIVVNTWERISVERWIFTAAHELGHLLLHPGAYDVSKTEENVAEENEANVFASYFLMPPKIFKGEFDDTRGLGFFERVMKLKRIFHVSWQTVIFRMTEDADPAKKAEYWKMFFAAARRRYGRGMSRTEEPEALPPAAFLTGAPAERAADEPKGLLSDDFVEDRRRLLVRAALERELLTLSKAAEILGLTIADMRQLANDWME